MGEREPKEPTSEQGSLQVVCAAVWSPSLLTPSPASLLLDQASRKPRTFQSPGFAPVLALP